MRNNPFLLFEMDFDPETFKKYHDINSSTPGIYAIPETDLNLDNGPTPAENEIPDEMMQGQDNSEEPNIIPTPQLSDEELEMHKKEIEPMKRAVLLQKLNSLDYILKNQYQTNTDLDLVLKYGPNLSYKSIYLLAINIINQIRQDSSSRQQQGQEA